MSNKINLRQMLESIKEDESLETAKDKRWASQEDIQQMIKKKKEMQKRSK